MFIEELLVLEEDNKKTWKGLKKTDLTFSEIIPETENNI